MTFCVIAAHRNKVTHRTVRIKNRLKILQHNRLSAKSFVSAKNTMSKQKTAPLF